MNIDIERIAITLQGASPMLGSQVAGALDGALQQQLSALKLRTLGSGVAGADLGVIQAPRGADARAVTDLIAARLADWLEREHGATGVEPDVTPSGKGR
jgi:hypothetical protein